MPEPLHGPFVLDVGMPTAKSLDDGDILIEGYAADFEVDRQGEKFLPGAFDEAIAKAATGGIPLLLEHNNSHPLGLVEQMKTDERGLWIRGRIMAKAAADAWDGAKGKMELIRRGVMKGLSVRGHSWGRMGSTGPEIGHIDLAEISITPVGAQPGALFGIVAKSMEKSMDYALDPEANKDIAWAAEGFAKLTATHTPDEIESAIEDYYKGIIKEKRDQLKVLRAAVETL